MAGGEDDAVTGFAIGFDMRQVALKGGIDILRAAQVRDIVAEAHPAHITQTGGSRFAQGMEDIEVDARRIDTRENFLAFF